MARTYRPLEWPYTAKAARDCAAEEVAVALRCIVFLMDVERDPEALRQLAKAIFHQQNALRHLESAGAQTKPVEP
jgi:hypothetical protein